MSKYIFTFELKGDSLLMIWLIKSWEIGVVSDITTHQSWAIDFGKERSFFFYKYCANAKKLFASLWIFK